VFSVTEILQTMSASASKDYSKEKGAKEPSTLWILPGKCIIR